MKRRNLVFGAASMAVPSMVFAQRSGRPFRVGYLGSGNSSEGEIPVEWPTTIEMVASVQTARLIGRDLPATLLSRADDLIS